MTRPADPGLTQVECVYHDGEEHESLHVIDWMTLDTCRTCDYPILWCEWCHKWVTCCLCGVVHSVDCPCT
jgi:hypothetical protein